MTEIIKDIPGYEGLYRISNLGYVDYMPKTKGSGVKLFGGVMKGKSNGNGYLQISLCKSGKKKAFYIHRLVALCFIPNPENKKEVNHKDGDKKNNCFINIEWVNRKENEKHAWQHGLKNMRGLNHSGSKPIIQMDMFGNEVKKWENAHQVKTTLGFSNAHISSCCNNKLLHAYGFTWKFA